MMSFERAIRFCSFWFDSRARFSEPGLFFLRGVLVTSTYLLESHLIAVKFLPWVSPQPGIRRLVLVGAEVV
jgi:hypothetical protein